MISIFQSRKTHICIIVAFSEMINPYSGPPQPSCLSKLSQRPFTTNSSIFHTRVFTLSDHSCRRKWIFRKVCLGGRWPFLCFGNVQILKLINLENWNLVRGTFQIWKIGNGNPEHYKFGNLAIWKLEIWNCGNSKFHVLFLAGYGTSFLIKFGEDGDRAMMKIG